MPWSVKDVDEHIKGLTDKQKDVWVDVANSALARCVKKSGEKEKCEASAIKQANSVVSNMKQMQEAELFNIENMEIFKIGTHNGDTFTQKDLEEIVDNFYKLKEQVKPKLKITHFEDQISLAGLASYGEIVDIYIKEDKLFANIKNIPEPIITWIKSGTFAERSIEIWYQLEVEGKKYKNVLTAVALLGYELPAVPGMAPVFSLKDFSDIEMTDKELKAINFSLSDTNNLKISKGEILMETKDLEMLQGKVSDLEKKFQADKTSENYEKFKIELESLKGLIKESEDLKKNFDSLKQESDESKKKLDEASEKVKEYQKIIKEKELKALELEAITFVNDNREKIIPAIKQEVIELYKNLDNSNKISFSKKENDKEEKLEQTLLEMFKSIFSKLPKFISIETFTSQEDNTNTPILYKRGDETYKGENVELDKKIKELMSANKDMTYEQAFVEISKIKKQ